MSDSVSTGDVCWAVIPAAGFGTRSLPWSKAVPKEMLPIVDVPAIQLIVEEAIAAGLKQIVVVTGRGKVAIEDHFDRAPELEAVLAAKGREALLERVIGPARDVEVVFVRQKEALGLGHAVLAAKAIVGTFPFAVLLPDDLIDNGEGPSGIRQLMDVFENRGGGCISVMEVAEGQQHLYGIVSGAADSAGMITVEAIVEKPSPSVAPSRSAVIGRYLLPAETWAILETTEKGHGGEIQLTDALAVLAQAGRLTGVPLRGVRHDIGNPLGFLEANLHYGLARPELGDKIRILLSQTMSEG